MNRLLLATTLLGASTAALAAQEVARVVSSTPVTQQVAVPRQVCTQTPGAQPAQQCTTQTIYENRTVGYAVIYEYAGKQYSVQMPQDPGPTLRLQITAVEAAAAQPAAGAAVGNGATSAANPTPSASDPVADPAWAAQNAGAVPAYPYPYTYAYYGAPGYVSYYGSPYLWGPVVGLGVVGGYYGVRRHFGGHGRRR